MKQRAPRRRIMLDPMRRRPHRTPHSRPLLRL